MRTDVCHREDELLDALARGFVGPELSEHVAACESCSEIRLVAGGLLDERVDAIAESPVPSAGTMLMRMQMRHRQEAQAAARRSLLIGQAVTLAVALGLTMTIFGSDLVFEARQVVAAIKVSTPLLLAAATYILAAPIAGWVAIRQK